MTRPSSSAWAAAGDFAHLRKVEEDEGEDVDEAPTGRSAAGHRDERWPAVVSLDSALRIAGRGPLRAAAAREEEEVDDEDEEGKSVRKPSDGHPLNQDPR